MDLALIVVTFGGVIFTGLSATAAVVQARVAIRARDEALEARDASLKARDETIQLATEANDAFKRQAAAQERANELAEAQLPRDEAEWRLEHIRGVSWVVRNVGRKVATKANLYDITDEKGWLRFETQSPKDIEVDDVIEFTVLTANGSPNPRVEVRWWHDETSPMRTKAFTLTARG
jgi:hypothetical protein